MKERIFRLYFPTSIISYLARKRHVTEVEAENLPVNPIVVGELGSLRVERQNVPKLPTEAVKFLILITEMLKRLILEEI